MSDEVMRKVLVNCVQGVSRSAAVALHPVIPVLALGDRNQTMGGREAMKPRFRSITFTSQLHSTDFVITCQ